MHSMFSECYHLKSLDLSNFDTSNVTTMRSMFNWCKSLMSLDLSSFNTSKVTNMHYMFYDCNSLASLDISSFDFSNVKDADAMLDNCSSLTDLKFGINLRASLDLHYCPLSHESALSVIDGLAEVERTRTVTFSEDTYNMLSAEDIKKAEDKNWKININ